MCVELSGQKQSAGVLASIGGKSEGKYQDINQKLKTIS